MRDGLTFLAGLVLVALLAALAAPLFVDWNQHRSAIEDQLRRATGLEIVTTGTIGLRFLPSPRIEVSGVRIGQADPLGTRLTATTLRVDMELAPLLRGQIALERVDLDGVDLTLAARGGALRLPAGSGRASLPAITQLTLSRGQVAVVDAGGSMIASGPFALEASLPGGAAPWRINSEVAGYSVRLTTGDRDPAGRTRLKLAVSASAGRGEFDGWLGLDQSSEGLAVFQPEGQIVLALAGEGEAPPPLTLNARLLASGAGFNLSALTLDGGPMGRLEGEATWSGRAGERGRVTLQSRRVDLAAWLAGADAILRPARELAAPLAALPDADVDMSFDQISYRGEEATDVKLALRRSAAGWAPLRGQIRFAGAQLSFDGGEAIRAVMDAPDLRRIALAMQRLDMPQGLAEDIAALGQLTGEATIVPDGASWRIAQWRAQGRFGQASGAGHASAGRIRIGAAFAGADLLFLARPLTALAALAPQALEFDLTGQSLTIGGSPPGTARLVVSREQGRWQLSSASARGFDGLELDVARGASGQPPGFQLQARRADAIAALAERLSPAAPFTQAIRAMRGLSPVRLSGTVSEATGGWSVAATGQAGALGLEARGQVSASGVIQTGEVALASSQRGLLFQALGLPEPEQRAVASRLTARLGASGPSLLLSGADGLSAEGRGAWAPDQPGQLAGPLQIRFIAPSAGAILPAAAAAQAGAGAVQGRFDLRPTEGGLGIEGLEAEIGGARLSGALELKADGSANGRLVVPTFDMSLAAGWLGAGAAPLADGIWSGARFAPGRTLPALDLALESQRFLVPSAGVLAGRLQLSAGEDRVRITQINLASPSLKLAGSVEAERNGGLLALRVNGRADGVELQRLLGGDFTGSGAVEVQLGASGESPARLIAALTGAGRFTARGLSIARLDPAALERIAERLSGDIIETDAAQLVQSVRAGLESGSWRVEADAPLQFVVAGGVARLSPFADEKPAASLSASGSFDLRNARIELRAAMQGRSAPKGWSGALPQIAVNWRGDWRAPARSYDVSALSNAVSQRALQREIERVEALEADIRERAAFNRRLRAERERREEELRVIAAEARAREERLREERAREEQARQEQARKEQARLEQARQDRLREERARAERDAAERAARASTEAPAPAQQPGISAAEPRGPQAAPALPPPVSITPLAPPLSRPTGALN
ncbi:MAG: AsmA family protein [Bosea sp.]|nr:AsmA family protein [Bosea sp. (in: a-proteobacteria)]